jgi:hypothetical protein
MEEGPDNPLTQRREERAREFGVPGHDEGPSADRHEGPSDE